MKTETKCVRDFILLLLLAFITGLMVPAAFGQVGASVPTLTIPKPGGTITLTNCTVTKVEPDGVRVSHDTGFAKVPYSHMPQQWRDAVPYDPVKAAEHKRITEAPAPVQEVPTPTSNEGKLLTTAEVKKAWYDAANPANVSGLQVDYSRTEGQQVSKVRPGSKVRFHGTSRASAAASSKEALQAYRSKLLSGELDIQIELATVQHNLGVYTARGDAANVTKCTERLKVLQAMVR